MRIQHNIAAMNSYRQLGGNNNALSKNLEKLSSGFRINRAGDDAAGLAISEKMRSQIKGLESPVAGDADCLLFPNIESGNVFYKANSKLVPGVRQAGILVGAKVPCVLSSRADSTDTKLNSIAVAAMSV